MRLMQPAVEILLAAYHGEKYLPEQLDSLLSQTWENWRLTVSDDGSTDGTAGILDAYCARHPQRIVRVRHAGRFGNARDHFFWLMEQCKSPYMLLCDQDDVWYPRKVEKTMSALLEMERQAGAETPLLVFTDQTPTDERLRPIAPSLMRMQRQFCERIDYRSLLMQNVVTGCAMGFNQALASLALACESTSPIIMHDWWLGVVAARFGKVRYLDESTMAYRQHAGNSVGAKDVQSASYIAHKLAHLRGTKQSIRRKKAQARAFQATYAARLTAGDHAFLSAYARPRSGIAFYMRHRALIHGFWRFAGALLLG